MNSNRFIKPFVLTLTCVAAFSIHAQPMETKGDYSYATIKGGVVTPTAMGGNSGLAAGIVTYTGGLAIGRTFTERFAAELEYSHRGKNTARSYNSGTQPENSKTRWSTSSNTIMANLSANIIEDSKIVPYLKGGIGMSINKAHNYVYSNTDAITGNVTQTYAGKTHNHFAWQIGFGLNFKTTKIMDIQVQYMFIDRGQVETNKNYTSSTNNRITTSPARIGRIKDHAITLGLTLKF
jgi:opacity protein-like surface antigen